MSVLNKVLRDLEQRGAPAPQFAGAASSTAAMPRAAPRRNRVPLRTAVWAGVVAVVCVTLGAYSWQVERLKASTRVAKPLGAAQFEAALPKDSAPDMIAAAQAKPTPSAPDTSTARAITRSNAPEAAPASPPVDLPTAKPAAVADAMVAQSVATEKAAPEAAPATSPLEVNAKKLATTGAAAPVTKRPASQATIASLQTDRDSATTPRPAEAPERLPTESAPPATKAASAAAPIVARKSNPEDLQVERAAEFIARGRSHEAMALLTQILSTAPNHHSARQALAALQAESGRRDLALQTLLAGAALEPARFAVVAARLQAESGDAEGALMTLERVPTAQRDADYDALVGGLAQRAGQHAVAAEAFARAVRSPRAPAIWWAGLGHSLDSLGQRAQAQQAFTRAMSDPALPPALRSFITQRLAELAAARPSTTPAVRESAPLAALPR